MATSDMIFYIEVEPRASTKRDLEPKQSLSASLQQAIRRLSTPEGVFGAQILQHVQNARESSSKCTDIEQRWRIAEQLASVGYRASVKQAVGGGRDGTCFDRLNHTFIEVQLDGDKEGTCSLIICEPTFRDIFTLQHPSPRYSQVLKEVPEVFVGPKGRLMELVKILSKELELSFAASVRSCPPWRKYKGMVSRWNPKFFRKQTGPRTLGPKVDGNQPKVTFASFGSFSASDELPLRQLSGFVTKKEEPTLVSGVEEACPLWAKDTKPWQDTEKIIAVAAAKSIRAMG